MVVLFQYQAQGERGPNLKETDNGQDRVTGQGVTAGEISGRRSLTEYA